MHICIDEILYPYAFDGVGQINKNEVNLIGHTNLQFSSQTMSSKNIILSESMYEYPLSMKQIFPVPTAS